MIINKKEVNVGSRFASGKVVEMKDPYFIVKYEDSYDVFDAHWEDEIPSDVYAFNKLDCAKTFIDLLIVDNAEQEALK